MTEITYPAELVCPISQDLMNDPVKITHLGSYYIFDRNCIETWKTTPSGDQNPLTMLPGFKEAQCKSAPEIKRKVREFREKHGIEIDIKTEKVKLEPFSDYQQIQDDETEARRLHRELNGPEPSDISGISVSWINDIGETINRYLEITPSIAAILMSSDFPENLREALIDFLVEDARRSYARENNIIIPNDNQITNYMGMRSGFLN